MFDDLKIPKERISVLIGKNGKTKSDIEKSTNTKIIVEDDVLVEGEPLDVLTVHNIIKAIGRGFSPEDSKDLMDENKTLHIIQLDKKRNILIRVKSRLIGTNGKAKKKIELLTHTKISVYGKTVSIIGEYENVEVATKAIEKLVSGSPHKNVYKFLEKYDL
jgi:ribosomal RNA assembly protein